MKINRDITLEYCIDKLVIAGDPISVKDQIYKFVEKQEILERCYMLELIS